MTIPNINDLPQYKGKLFTNIDWNALLQKIISYLTAGTYDVNFKTVESQGDIELNGFRITGQGDPTEDSHSVTLGYYNNQSKYLYTPFSVASGKKDVNGAADFISKVSNTSVKIEAGDTNPDIICVYPNGATETISADYTIENITSNGTYTIVKEYTSNPVATTSVIAIDTIEPDSPSNGDYWLDISIKPYTPYKRVAGAWVETQFLQLGEFEKDTGTIGTPISYAFNGVYESELFTHTTETTETKNHNIGSTRIYIDYSQENTDNTWVKYNYYYSDTFNNGVTNGNASMGYIFSGDKNIIEIEQPAGTFSSESTHDNMRIRVKRSF